MQKLLLVYYYSENRATREIWKVLPNMIFSPILGGGGRGEIRRRSEHAQASYPGLSFHPPGFGRKESSGTGLVVSRTSYSIHP